MNTVHSLYFYLCTDCVYFCCLCVQPDDCNSNYFSVCFQKTRNLPLLFPYRSSCSYRLTSALPRELVDADSKWANGIPPALSTCCNGLFAWRTAKKKKKKRNVMKNASLCSLCCDECIAAVSRKKTQWPRCDGSVWGFVLILSIALSGHMITNYIRERAVMEMNLIVKLYLLFIFDQDDSILNLHQDQSR